jgi:hypothetical protein
MRKTCDSSKTLWTKSFSFTALSKSCPNGFSMITRAPEVRSASRSISTTACAAFGGTER